MKFGNKVRDKKGERYPGERRFVCYFWFQGWSMWQLGFHICWYLPNIEIHVPCGFIRIGWCRIDYDHPQRVFGWDPALPWGKRK